MNDQRTDEQLLRTWLQEPVWMPESDLGSVVARAHQSPQHRGLLPQFDSRGLIRMLSATKLIVAGVVIALFGGFLMAGVLSDGNGDGLPPAPAALTPTDEPDAAPLEIPKPAEQAAEPPPAVDSPKKVHWEDGGVTLDARDFTIKTQYGTYRPQAPHSISGYHHGYGGSPEGLPRAAELEADWKKDGAWMRLRFELHSDGTDWWIRRIRTYDGHPSNGQYLNYPGLKERTRTKVGRAFTGSLDIRPTGSERKSSVLGARLQIEDMRLEAFVPGSIPTPEPRVEQPRQVLTFEQTAMLPGQSQRVTADWCLGDRCWPAQDTKWSTDTPKIVRVQPLTGSWTQVTALKPGAADLSARAFRYSSGTGFGVKPRPGSGTFEERFGKPRRHVVTPREKVLKPGEFVVLTGWLCPTRDAKQVGKDGLPSTADDDCRTRDLRSVRALPYSGMAHVGTFGPSAVMVADSFEVDDDTIQAAPVFFTFDFLKGTDLVAPNLYIRDAEWRGPDLGDLDGDGEVDGEDVALVATVLTEHGPDIAKGAAGWDEALDLNVDYHIDEVDLDVIDAIAKAHAGEIVPEPAGPPFTPPPMVPGGPAASPAGTPTASPGASAVAEQ